MAWTEELWLSILRQADRLLAPPPEWQDLPAAGRLTITRPELLKPFEQHNRRHPEQAIRPHGFISVRLPETLHQRQRPATVRALRRRPTHSARDLLE